MWAQFLCLAAAVLAVDAAGAGAARLVCYVENSNSGSFSECTHLVYAGDARGEKLDGILKEYRKSNPRLKIVLRVAEIDKDLSTLLKSKHVQGLEIYNAHKVLNRTKITETVEAARSTISSSGGGPLFLALPAHPELLAKYYDLRALVKKVDLMMVQTHALGLVKKMTYHPSRLSGLWDMMNTDSVVDLVVGLGVPASKVVISLPATARKFTLLNETLSTPGSPTAEEEPAEVDQGELCRLLREGRWTLERDQDLSAPYAFKNKTWISFEDASSVDVKGKYARVRGLAGLALHNADRDADTPCGPSLKAALAKVLNQQSRAPRAAVLRSLEHEILSAAGGARALDALQVSPYRITQVVDSDGVIHSIREDTRTEFTCSRQGYFVHPRSCARFYRCVKFDQLSPEYTVFEFDCPAGLAFDSRYEVCVWPGSLPHSQACPGSSEIAPVPHTRFICPEHEGYYADPENCRWFFACLDHGKAPLTAYEFRCPFGLGFDAERLKCDWPWLVPACGNIARYEAEAHGFSAAILTGAAGFQGQTADAVNVAAHQSLISGASLDNLVGIQGGFLTKDDALDSNFIASQEIANGAYSTSHGISHDVSQGQLANGLAYQDGNVGSANLDLVRTTNYNDDGRYTSGSIILDEYRLPTKSKSSHGITHNVAQSTLQQNSEQYDNGYSQSQYNKGYSQSYASSSGLGKATQYENGYNGEDNSGAYVHDPSGDYAEPYRHVDSPSVPYQPGYEQSNDYKDFSRYVESSENNYNNKYQDKSGQYIHDYSGSYADSGSTVGAYKDYSSSYNSDYSDSYAHHDSGKYVAGVYRTDGHIGGQNSDVTTSGEQNSQVNVKQYHGVYSAANSGDYLSDSKAYTGASHTLTAGAINVGLVGKTTLVDPGYTDQRNDNYKSTVSYDSTHQTLHPGHVSYISQPAVSIHHLGTDSHNLDGYSFVTTPTSSGVPTTATPFAFTTALPTTTYKTTYVSEFPKSNVKEIFGYVQPAITHVKPSVVYTKQEYTTPSNVVTNINSQDAGYSFTAQQSSQSAAKSESGYQYAKPAIPFEDGTTYITAAPPVSVSTYKPQGFSHSQQTLHNVESVGFDYSKATPVTEIPFKKLVAYTTGPSLNTYTQPTIATIPQSFSQETVHKVDASHIYNSDVNIAEHEFAKLNIAFDEAQEHTTALPTAIISSTYQPQAYSHQTLHNVDVGRVNTYSQTSKQEGSEYKFEEIPKTVFQYSTPVQTVTTYRPHVYSQQTVHKAEPQHYVTVSSTPKPFEITYQQPTVSTYENPIYKYTQQTTPATYGEREYTPQIYNQQTVHKTVENKVYSIPSTDLENTAYQTSVSYEAPKFETKFTTAKPVVTYHQSQVLSQHTLHKVEPSKINTYSQGESGYEYQKPAINYVEEPKINVQYTTPAPVTVSTHKPHSYSHQNVHVSQTQKFYPVTSTTIPNVELTYQQPSVSVYENPLQKYTQKETYESATVPVYTQTYKPVIKQYEITHVNHPVEYNSAQQSHQNIQLGQEGYLYSQPEIQRNDETFNVAKSYSDASLVSQQAYHQANIKGESKNDITFVSTTPATLAYEDHYVEYEPSRKQYEAPEYIPPKTNYQESYTVSAASTPVVQQNPTTFNFAEESKYKTFDYSQKYDNNPVPEIPLSPSRISQARKESVHISTFPGTSVITRYKQVAPETPEIQLAYKAEEYLPPQIITATSTSKPPTYTKEYLPPITTLRTTYKSTTQEPIYKFVESTTQFKAPDYLPPQEEKQSKVLHYESFGLNNKEESQNYNIRYNDNQEYKISEPVVISSTFAPVQRKQNIVIETAKSNLLGFGTVGPDAGLVSQASYTTSVPYVSSTYKPVVSTTSTPLYVESTTQYKAPEYLPPVSANEKDNPYKPVFRKHNIVVETAKSQSLGYGVESDISLATYNTQAPRIVSSSETYSQLPQKVTKPIFKPEFIEDTPSIPVRRVKPKVAIVTKINDFNPLLVRKLGAVCSCQSPVLILKGKRPNVQNDFDDYSSEYESDSRGDISDKELARTYSAKLRIPAVKAATASPVVTSTFNPIIVPDDSYYQDLQEDNNYESVASIGRGINFDSSTPPVIVSTTEKFIRIRPRVKTVTVAPTYKTVLLNQDITPRVSAKQSTVASTIDSQAFDRYGPGGWRSRDETLQGSVDCQRAGLFRHPKQCNKFYACRWDCTKQRFTLHVFNCPVHLSFDESLGACNWPSQGPACQGDTLLTNSL